MKRWHRMAVFVVADLALFGLVGLGAALIAAMAYVLLEIVIAERREVRQANRMVQQVALLELDRGESRPAGASRSGLSDRMRVG